MNGTEGAQWHWQDGGIVQIERKSTILRLHDLTGFDGRCDAILFSTHHTLVVPNHLEDMREFRRKLLGYPDSPPEAGEDHLGSAKVNSFMDISEAMDTRPSPDKLSRPSLTYRLSQRK